MFVVEVLFIYKSINTCGILLWEQEQKSSNLSVTANNIVCFNEIFSAKNMK